MTTIYDVNLTLTNAQIKALLYVIRRHIKWLEFRTSNGIDKERYKNDMLYYSMLYKELNHKYTSFMIKNHYNKVEGFCNNKEG